MILCLWCGKAADDPHPDHDTEIREAVEEGVRDGIREALEEGVRDGHLERVVRENGEIAYRLADSGDIYVRAMLLLRRDPR